LTLVSRLWYGRRDMMSSVAEGCGSPDSPWAPEPQAGIGRRSGPTFRHDHVGDGRPSELTENGFSGKVKRTESPPA